MNTELTLQDHLRTVLKVLLDAAIEADINGDSRRAKILEKLADDTFLLMQSVAKLSLKISN